MLELFQYEFMQRAFMVGLAIGVSAPLIGSFLVIRRFSLLADTLAHTSLAGAAAGLLFGLNPITAATGTAVVAGVAMEQLRGSRRVYAESVLALFLTGSLALATVLISLGSGFTSRISGYLFGSIATVTSTDLVTILVTTGLVLASTLAFFSKFYLTALDEELAAASGLPVRHLNYALSILTAATVAVSISVVGALLVGALTVIPVLAAMQLGKSFRHTVILAVLLSLTAVTVGLTLSYYYRLASGGAIVLVALVLFILSLLRRRR